MTVDACEGKRERAFLFMHRYSQYLGVKYFRIFEECYRRYFGHSQYLRFMNCVYCEYSQ